MDDPLNPQVAPPGALPPPVRFGPVPAFASPTPASPPAPAPAATAAVPTYSPVALAAPPPGWAPMAAPVLTVQATPASGARWAAVVTVVGAALVAAATFLPWTQVEVEGFGIRSGNGWTELVSTTVWGPGLIVLAGVLAAAAAPAAAGLRLAPAMVITGVAGIACLALSLLQLADVTGDHPGMNVEPAYGVIVLVVASAVAAVSAGVVAYGARAAKVAAPRAVGAVG